MKTSVPSLLYIVRHGQSAGNVARDAAEKAGAVRIDIALRDVDVPLSPLGIGQSEALGAWLAELPRTLRPDVIFSSPYLRAAETATLAVQAAGAALSKSKILLDERLREREFGILDRFTKGGIVATFPEQNALRVHLGKFYYRPPGGESWCDVLLRLRAFLEMLAREYAGRRVLIVCHSVVVLCFRYLLEEMNEAEILRIDRGEEIANCSVTSYRLGKAGALELDRFNYVAPMKEAGEPVTRKTDVPTN